MVIRADGAGLLAEFPVVPGRAQRDFGNYPWFQKGSKSAGGTISLTLELTPAGVVTEIRDTGIGIPPEAHARIFDRFYQVDNTRTRHFGGTGLGLAIVKGLLEAMGGQIEVASQPGLGSRFRVFLPAATAAEAAANP